jgi:hypothetical protein
MNRHTRTELKRMLAIPSAGLQRQLEVTNSLTPCPPGECAVCDKRRFITATRVYRNTCVLSKGVKQTLQIAEIGWLYNGLRGSAIVCPANSASATANG